MSSKPPAFSGRTGGGGRLTSLGPSAREGSGSGSYRGGRGGGGRGRRVLNRGNNGNYIGKRSEGGGGADDADRNHQKVRPAAWPLFSRNAKC